MHHVPRLQICRNIALLTGHFTTAKSLRALADSRKLSGASFSPCGLAAVSLYFRFGRGDPASHLAAIQALAVAMDRMHRPISGVTMRQGFREYSGFGELLCLVVAWTVGLAAVWSEYATRPQNGSGNKVAVSQVERGPSGYFD
jgi:hypothetical protein